MVNKKSIISFITFYISSVISLNVTSIQNCPYLTPRSTPPVDVNDLRIDDIKIIGALGDRFENHTKQLNLILTNLKYI